MPDTTTATEQAARRFYEPIAAADREAADTLLPDSWEQIPLGKHSSPGRQGYRETIDFLDGAFSELSIEVEDVLVSGDRAAIRTVTRGKHTGAPVLGVAPAGASIELRASDFHQVQDGRIVRTWQLEDYLTLLQQITPAAEQRRRRSR